jgi:hypothetical protein
MISANSGGGLHLAAESTSTNEKNDIPNVY